MSTPEMAYRAFNAIRLQWDRRRSWRFDVPADIGAPVFPSNMQGDQIPRWREAYEAARDGQFAWFGTSWPAVEPPDWHLDPTTGLRWPDRMFGPAIPYRHDSRYGDVKYVWELNRLQYLQPIAVYARATGDDDAAGLVRRHIADWLKHNPPFVGINWSSGIELGLRAVSLAAIGTLIDLGDELNIALAQSLLAHGHWLARYPSRYSSANNHAIAEALGLLTVATALPALPQAASWARQARTMLERESLLQILPDGVGAEQAVGYQYFTMEMLALAALLGASTLSSRFSKANSFLRAITDTAGNAPQFGDDDDSQVFWSALGLPASLPYIYSFPRVRHNGNGNASRFREHPRTRAPDGLHHFPDGGYTVVREGAMHLTFDHGPLGYLSIAAHGHADALSIWLSIDGEPVLIDAGTYRYHGAGAVRDAFRGTAAHNTLTVAGADQSEIAGPFNWSHKANARAISVSESPWSVEAEHDGYLKRFGCIHRRRIEMAGNVGFTLIDTLSGTGGPWPVQAGFLVAPGQEIRYDGEVWHIGAKLCLEYNGPLKGEILEAEYSPSMGQILATYRLAFSGSMTSSDFSRFTFRVAG